ncbi:MAG TPA: HAMP domain-containing sensor histidine kinase, partial [Sphingomonas sp.]|nr:HAMP domain-containing sensor histidine kinase [Sphingomonas sp.]
GHGLGLALVAAIGTTANAIIAGDYSQRVPIDALGGTFAEQARTFNRMLDRIEALMDNLRQVSSDIAHDLRTPLTRLHATLREAAADELEERERVALIVAADRECNRILSLFAALLRIGEIQAGRRRAQVATIALGPLVEDIVESYAPAFADASRRIELAGYEPASIRGDADLFNQLLVNLIENALVHTPEASITRVSLSREVDAVVLAVSDNGAGIPASERGEVLRRFVRLERSRSTPGHGLGLALVAAIAAFHEAMVALDDAKPGLIVRIYFPAADEGTTF